MIILSAANEAGRMLRFNNNKFNIIVHCAAIARMHECEINKKKAYSVNVIGTSNLIKFVKIYDFGATLVGALTWWCHWLGFQSIFEVPGGKIF